MSWWMWILAGLGLLVAEVLNPGGFFMIFFGAGALLVGLLSATGIAEPLWLQLGLFSTFSVASLMLFRKPILARFGPRSRTVEVDGMAGGVATAVSDIEPGEVGKAEFRGAPWSARNGSGWTIKKGQRCTVERLDGLTIVLRAEQT